MQTPPVILWQDDDLLAINKPAGLLCLPDGYDPTLNHVRQVLEPDWGRLWIAHRLDKETSGVLILARTAAAHRSLSEQFTEHRITKRYHALICGDLNWAAKVVDLPLRSQVGRRKRTVADPRQGKPAVTRFELLENYGKVALVEARPLTGRTHQIRAHLYAINCSILADPLYGPTHKETSKWLARLGLHALEISLVHPVNQQTLVITAPFPEDFSRAVDEFRQQKR